MTEVPARLSIVTLGVRNMGVLRSFYRALSWPELSSGDDAWTGFLLGGILLALFPLPDLTAEAAPGSPAPTGWSGITLACTVSTREEVDTALAAAVAAGATPVADATDRTARRTPRAPCGPRTLAKLSPARSSGHAGNTPRSGSGGHVTVSGDSAGS